MMIFVAVFGAVSVVVISGCGTNPPANTNAPTNTANVAPTNPTKAAQIKVRAAELIQAYMEDKTKVTDIFKETHKADAVYKDKMVLLSGAKIKYILNDYDKDEPYIELKPDDPEHKESIAIRVFLAGTGTSRFKSLKEGQTITVLGKCVGVKTASIVIEDGILQ